MILSNLPEILLTIFPAYPAGDGQDGAASHELGGQTLMDSMSKQIESEMQTYDNHGYSRSMDELFNREAKHFEIETLIWQGRRYYERFMNKR